MRDLNFVPAWYPRALRRRRYFKLQLLASVVALFGLAIHGYMTFRQLRADRHVLTERRTALEMKRKEVKQLDELLELQAQLLSKQKIVAQLGVPVETTRLVSELEQCMNDSVSLSEFDIHTVERSISVSESVSKSKKKSDDVPTTSRRLEVLVRGTSPDASSVAMFNNAVADRRFLEQVRLTNTTEKIQDKRAIREFEMTFLVPLDYEPPVERKQ